MLRTVWTKLTRWVVVQATRFMPVARRRHIERWMRGRDQFQKLKDADVVVVSPGKSGRTWLRVMLSGYFHRAYGLGGDELIGFDNLHRKDPRIPRIFFTHDNYLKDYTGAGSSKRDFYDKRVIFMVRQPQDVVVSEYFNWKHRMRPGKMYLNDFPEKDEEVGLFDFMMRPCGLDRVLDLLDAWAKEMPQVKDLVVVRYEDLRADTAAEFRRVIEFLGGPDAEELIRESVEHASLENMRQMEQNASWLSGGRMKPTDKSNPQSYKVRRAKVGGYRDYFEDDEAKRIDEATDARLAPVWGYTPSRQPSTSA